MTRSQQRHLKKANKPAQLHARQTRSKTKHIADPAQNTRLLNDQLRALGLYAADTMGDGNCLFRALSDQLYGTESRHAQLRTDICNWVEGHKERYAPFCDDERGLDTHLECMRELGTYGGHVELSAFAHLMKRNVKVIQPGLVYVIEWNAGGEAEDPESSSSSPNHPQRHETLAETKSRTVYVAYHDWEHFSSIRNLRGPHAGLPEVVETPAETVAPTPASPVRSGKKLVKKPTSKYAGTAKHKPESSVSLTTTTMTASSVATPASVPSTSVSPSPSRLPSVGIDGDDENDDDHTLTSATQSRLRDHHQQSHSPVRAHRSPKRAFDESEGSSSSSTSVRRTKARLNLTAEFQQHSSAPATGGSVAEEEEASTPGLSAPSTSSSASSSSLSDAPSPEPEPEPAPEPEPEPEVIRERPMTRRERKAAGLPKSRAELMRKLQQQEQQKHGSDSGIGKIIIPGGRYKAPKGTAVNPSDDQQKDGGNEEWRTNGTGRLDVRGFRELRI